MILVTLGTQDKTFYRLLDNIEKCIDNGIIKEEVIVQAGYSSKYKSKHMKIFDLIPMDEFDKLISKCDLLITHGGVGSIIGGLSKDKKIIACPRLSKYKEHTNDHQCQIIDQFYESGYILKLDEDDDLSKVIERSKKFTPKKYKSNNCEFVKLVKEQIDKYLN
jgi:UDP-N-acetylglucosamine transferase subunit ALG13